MVSNFVSWIHFGDLHIVEAGMQNYNDFLALIEEANTNMHSGVNFAILPGDNADDGSEEQYRLVQDAVSRFRFPVHILAGDHDVATGSLSLFQKHLSRSPYYSTSIGGYRFLLLNSVAEWNPPSFGLGQAQMAWLRSELSLARRTSSQSVMFMHAYPSEHGADRVALRQLIRDNDVLLIEMGHTHYNELANDGQTVYAATRSTGQIEEGPAGFSVSTLDHGVVSWKFKPIGEWPLVMITSPADERLIINPSKGDQVVSDAVCVRARVWGSGIKEVTLSIGNESPTPMIPLGESMWSGFWSIKSYPNGSHPLTVRASTVDGRTAVDSIRALVSHEASYTPPSRRAVDSDNVLGSWPEKHILGTQLGPNKNGHPWPPSHRVGREV